MAKELWISTREFLVGTPDSIASVFASYGFLNFAADTPPFESDIRSNDLAHAQ